MLRYLTAIRELELAKARIEELTKREAELDARLLSEIDSNRRREDALIARLTAKDAQGAPMPQRALLRAAESAKADSEPLINLDDVDVDEHEHRLIVQRATEFWEQARANGIHYDLDLAIEHAKKDPSFLEN